MDTAKKIGPVETRLRASSREDIRNLCDLTDLELIDFADDYLGVPDECYEQAVFDAAQELLDERVPLPVEIDVEASLAKFKRDHAEFFPSATESTSERGAGRRKYKMSFSWARVAVIIVVLSLVSGLVAYAYNPAIIQPVLDLGDRVVRLISWGQSGALELPENVSEYSSLRQALDATGAEDAQAPTWVPRDFHLMDIRVVGVEEGTDEKSYWAMLNGNDRDLLFHIEAKTADAESYFDEKDEDGETTFLRGDISYHKATNLDTIQIKWDHENYKYSMVGELSENEYYHIIDSLK